MHGAIHNAILHHSSHAKTDQMTKNTIVEHYTVNWSWQHSEVVPQKQHTDSLFKFRLVGPFVSWYLVTFSKVLRIVIAKLIYLWKMRGHPQTSFLQTCEPRKVLFIR